MFGGSWGSALALAYAETHPERVTELVLRGIFTLRRSELDFYYNGGAGQLFPDRYERFLAPLGRPGLPRRRHRRLPRPAVRPRPGGARPGGGRLVHLGGGDHHPGARRRADRRLRRAGLRPGLRPDREPLLRPRRLVHRGPADRRGATGCADIPGVIVQGRYDVATPAVTAWDLHRAWPTADLRLVGDAGHAYSEPGIAAALVAATDRFAAGAEADTQGNRRRVGRGPQEKYVREHDELLGGGES